MSDFENKYKEKNTKTKKKCLASCHTHLNSCVELLRVDDTPSYKNAHKDVTELKTKQKLKYFLHQTQLGGVSQRTGHVITHNRQEYITYSFTL